VLVQLVEENIDMRLALATSAAVYLSVLGVAALPQHAQPAGEPARFDMEVRADFFAGISGDEARFKKAMARCEEILAANPEHAEALVWHGSGVLSMGGVAFERGDFKTGGELWGKGLEEMSRAVALAPDNVGVRVPRGATLLEAARRVQNPTQAQGLLRLAVDDYEHALTVQQATLASRSDHAKGELLFGLADGWARLGDKERARMYFTRLTTDAASSGRVPYAKAWLDGTPPAEVGRCTGCH
jgi:tetratricopeptide (TPR) repeat protein